MRWDALFEDLEARAAAFEVAERAAEVEERTRGEFAAVSTIDRLRAGGAGAVRLRVCGARTLSGAIRRIGADWLLLGEETGREALVPLSGVLGVRGLGRHAVAPGAADVVASRLPLRSALRGIARDRSAVRVELVDGTALDATIDRVGADFVEVATHAAGELRRRGEVRDVEVIPTAGIAAIRR
jgi:hypothetical protein